MDEQKPPSGFWGTFGNAVTVGGFLVSLAAGVVSYVWKASLRDSVITAITTLVVFLLLLLAYRRVLRAWLRRHRHDLEARFLAFVNGLLYPKKDYECRNKVVEYTYLDRENLTFQVNYDVKFTSGSHREITDRLKWSAGQVDKISSVVPGQKIVMLKDEEKDDILFQLGHQDFHIRLSKEQRYTKHDGPVPTGYRCDGLHDPEHKAMSCLVIGIHQKLNHLTLRVRFNKSLKVSNIRKLKYARYPDSEPYDSEPGTPKMDEAQEFQCVEFKIKHPIPGGKYAIDWEFQP